MSRVGFAQRAGGAAATPTSSLVPTHAITPSGSTSTPNRRRDPRRPRRRAAPACRSTAGSRSPPGAASASARSGDLGHRVDRVCRPSSRRPRPAPRRRAARSASSRSCGYGGGTNPGSAPPSGSAYRGSGVALIRRSGRRRSRTGEVVTRATASRQPGPHAGAGVVVHLDEHLAVAVQRRQHVAPVVRAPRSSTTGSSARSRSPIASGSLSTPSPVRGRDRERARVRGRASCVTVVGIGDVDLVEHEQLGHLGRRRSRAAPSRTASIWRSGVDRGRRRRRARAESASTDLLERRPERLDQLVRQAAHEADGVGQQHRLAAGQAQPAGASGRASRTAGPRRARRRAVSRFSSVDFPAFV